MDVHWGLDVCEGGFYLILIRKSMEISNRLTGAVFMNFWRRPDEPMV